MAINQNRSQIRFIERQKVYIDVKIKMCRIQCLN